MKDNEIRKILIEYLKATSDEIRIFQEKNIGNSVCDVMAVTDILIAQKQKDYDDIYKQIQCSTLKDC